jgi:adenine deaminase
VLKHLDQMSDETRRELFRQMRDSGTWISTTLTSIEGSVLVGYERAKAIVDDTRGKIDPRRRYIGGYLLSDWREQVEEKKDPEQAKMEGVLRGQLESFFRDFRQMREEGVRFLAGTDVAVALIYPGFSMHQELEIYTRQLGFSPLEALRVATHNPAEFYGIESKQGAIAAGQAADLLLLDQNPLEDIRNTRKLRAVVARGRLLDRARLDKMLRETMARAASQQ